MAMPGSQSCAGRFLLELGPKFQEALDTFQSYGEEHEPNLEARRAEK